MTFGGLVGQEVRAHSVSTGRETARFFGLRAPDRLFRSAPQDYDAVFRTVEDLERAAASGLPSRARALFNNSKISNELQLRRSEEYMPPRFLAALRRQAWPYSEQLLGASGASELRSRLAGGVTLVLHVRRGDLRRNKRDAGRLIPDEWYFDMLRAIRQHAPAVDVHVFSSTEGFYRREDFRGYERRGARVHLDGDPLRAWAFCSRAHIFVMSASAFSYVPAVLNPGCVIYPRHFPHALFLAHWLDGGDPSRPGFDQALRECVARGAAAAGTTPRAAGGT
mmetsp:Transcript_26738/g.83342  ORF Transcript_26738/g.83342 Transcript_26738/m.83342 type:complete len:280 (+) Transcript_26738:112-951(+)